MQGVFNYGGKDYELAPAKEGASAEGCSKLVQLVLKQNEPCGAEQVCPMCLPCSWSHQQLLTGESLHDQAGDCRAEAQVPATQMSSD